MAYSLVCPELPDSVTGTCAAGWVVQQSPQQIIMDDLPALTAEATFAFVIAFGARLLRKQFGY